MTGGNSGDSVVVGPGRAEGAAVTMDRLGRVVGPDRAVAAAWSRGGLDHPGRKRLDDRKVLCGILFVLYTGIPWEFLPQELGFGSGMTCWRRLRDWHAGGRVAAAARGCCWPSCTPPGRWTGPGRSIDSSHVRAVKGGPKRVRARSIAPGRARKHHVITEAATAIPLAVYADRRQPQRRHPADRRWSTAIPPVRGRRRHGHGDAPRTRSTPTAAMTMTSTARQVRTARASSP